MADEHGTARQEILDGMCGESTYWPDTAAAALDAYVVAREQTLRQALEQTDWALRRALTHQAIRNADEILAANKAALAADAPAPEDDPVPADERLAASEETLARWVAPAPEEIQTSASRWVNAMLTEGHTQNAVWVSVQVALERAARSAPEETQT